MFTYNVDEKSKILSIYNGSSKVLDITGTDFDKLCNTLNEIDLNCSETGNKVLYRKGKTYNLDKKDSDFIQRWTTFYNYADKMVGLKHIYTIEEIDRYTFSVIYRDDLSKKYIHKVHKKKPSDKTNFVQVYGYYTWLVRTEVV